MKLGKPPIVQAWIEFQFEHVDKSPDWGWESATGFFDLFQDEYPEREVRVEHQFQIEQLVGNQKPRITGNRDQLTAIRAFRTGRGRSIQLTKDTLVCNFVRTQASGYEGFDALKGESLSRLQAYQDYSGELHPLRIAIQYVNLVRIPFRDERINLAEYFTIGHDLPESEFGPTLDYVVQYATRPPGTQDLLEIRLGSDKSDPDGPVGHFLLNLRLSLTRGLGPDNDAMSERLETAHQCLLDTFRKSFTDLAWTLFEPLS